MNTTAFRKQVFLIGAIVLSFLMLPALFGGQSTTSDFVGINDITGSAIQTSQIDYSTDVDRVLESLDVTVDLSAASAEPHTDAIEVNMTISLSNGTVFNITQNSDSSDIWSLKYTPDKDAPIGQHQFNISAYTGSAYHYSSDYTFNIKNSAPRISLSLSETEIYRNTTLYFNVTPSDAENSLAQLTWSSAIIRVSNGDELSGTNDSVLEKSYEFPETYSDGNLGPYYVQASVEDKDGNKTTIKRYFTVLNNVPYFNDDYSVTFEDSEYTDPASNEILRDSGNIRVDINVTDVERTITSDVKLRAIAKDPEKNSITLGTYDPSDQTPDEYYEFNINENIPAYEAAGLYELHLITYEDTVGISSNTTMVIPMIVVNNPPDGDEITYTINEVNSTEGSGIVIQEYEDIDFRINVEDCDVEGIEFIQVALIDADGEWMNFTLDNTDSNLVTLTIRAKDLTPGQWNAYIYAIDYDGARAVTANVMSFDIEKDTFSIFLPYLMLIIGAAAGFGIAFLIFGTRYMQLQKDVQEGVVATEESAPKRARTRRVRQKRVTKKKSSKKKAKTSDEEKEASKKPKKGTKGSRRRMMRRIDKD